MHGKQKVSEGVLLDLSLDDILRVSTSTTNPFKTACCVTVPGTAVTAERVTSLVKLGWGVRGAERP